MVDAITREERELALLARRIPNKVVLAYEAALTAAEAECDALKAENERLREALKPFADISIGRESLGDDFEFEIARTARSLEFSVGPNVSRARLLMWEFRRARAALTGDANEA